MACCDSERIRVPQVADAYIENYMPKYTFIFGELYR